VLTKVLHGSEWQKLTLWTDGLLENKCGTVGEAALTGASICRKILAPARDSRANGGERLQLLEFFQADSFSAAYSISLAE
jgi:hypothetical protein